MHHRAVLQASLWDAITLVGDAVNQRHKKTAVGRR